MDVRWVMLVRAAYNIFTNARGLYIYLHHICGHLITIFLIILKYKVQYIRKYIINPMIPNYVLDCENCKEMTFFFSLYLQQNE